MEKAKKIPLGIGVDFGHHEIPVEERIKIIADAGFDAVFSGWGSDDYIDGVARQARACGLIYQSVHAPYGRVNLMWERGPEGAETLAELCACLEACSKNGVGIMVSHVWIGFGEEHPNDIGIRRFSELLRRAGELGVRVAFENTEGEAYLEYIKDNLWDDPSAGFCIDTGHEMCYNRGRDLISKYGSGGKLIATHLNDNMGVTTDEITWLDDAHLLPFDGIADWQGIASRLSAAGCCALTSELTVKSKPGRDTHRIYSGLSCEEFVRLAFERAARLADMMQAGA